MQQLENDSRSSSSLSLKQMQMTHRQGSEASANSTQSPSHGTSKVQRSISASAQKGRRFSTESSSANRGISNKRKAMKNILITTNLKLDGKA